MTYRIIYDYTDKLGHEYRNNVEIFTGTWAQLKARLEQMRKQGYYNLFACCEE